MAADVHDLSPYNYANNDPSLLNDPLGDKVCAECEEEARSGPMRTTKYRAITITGTKIARTAWSG